ncbi:MULTISPECIES: YfcC family protein [unclassified Granulicatella]|uniref:YfcC family protein n=1 Tax=unclassified Granulicatella TaxID=2630493 RepID=UPI0010730A9C|nr:MULTISPECIES: YfcC family protein [unclassified Granulicatella]MBF0780772.1 YfcC family protein [Granulicatella sp. 19428wC4_WM01]TFU93845.1 YfcC family protein [Granulicatella sp. WM01]
MTVKVKKGFKMPSSYTVLVIMIALMAVLTWIIPAGSYKDGVYTAAEQSPQGLFDVLMAPVRAMLGTPDNPNPTLAAIDVSFFIIMVGAFIGVMTETGALDVGIASIVKRYKGKEKRLIPVLMIIFALGGTTYGMGEETMAFYPLLIPVMMAVGFDSVTAVAVILIGSQVGCLASTVNPFATGVASASAGISVADGILLRVIFFVVMVTLSIMFVYRYASKIEKDPTKSLVYHQRKADEEFFLSKQTNEDVKLTGGQKASLVLFGLTFVIMILSLIPWSEFGITLFKDLNGIVGKLPGMGRTLALGEWYFPEVTMLFIAMSILIGFASKMGEARFIKAFMNGAADLLSVALICAVARGIQVIMNDGNITGTILNFGAGALSGLSEQVFVVLAYIFYLPMSILIPSTSGLASATIGIIAPLGQLSKVGADLVVTAFQAASGAVNLLAPSSGIVMGALALGRIELGTWWKFAGKLVGLLVIVSIVLLVLGTFI